MRSGRLKIRSLSSGFFGGVVFSVSRRRWWRDSSVLRRSFVAGMWLGPATLAMAGAALMAATTSGLPATVVVWALFVFAWVDVFSSRKVHSNIVDCYERRSPCNKGIELIELFDILDLRKHKLL